MSNHTPGPWKYEATTKTIRSKTENYWLATMDSWEGAVDHAANARLIAAAPDLLAALEGCLALMKRHGIWNLIHDKPIVRAQFDQLVAVINAREAIAKAKGE